MRFEFDRSAGAPRRGDSAAAAAGAALCQATRCDVEKRVAPAGLRFTIIAAVPAVPSGAVAVRSARQSQTPGSNQQINYTAKLQYQSNRSCLHRTIKSTPLATLSSPPTSPQPRETRRQTMNHWQCRRLPERSPASCSRTAVSCPRRGSRRPSDSNPTRWAARARRSAAMCAPEVTQVLPLFL